MAETESLKSRYRTIKEMHEETGLSDYQLRNIARRSIENRTGPAYQPGGKNGLIIFDMVEFKQMLKAGLLVILMLIFIGAVKTEAAVITGDVGIGGWTYYQDRLLAEGHTMSELINRSGVYPTDEEYQMLYRVVEAEASGCTKEQKMNVCSCILARLINPTSWPSSIEGVIFQSRQFSVIANGMYDRAVPDAETIEAVNEVVRTIGLTHDCEFFCSYGCKSSWFASKGEPVFRDGAHRYYY